MVGEALPGHERQGAGPKPRVEYSGRNHVDPGSPTPFSFFGHYNESCVYIWACWGFGPSIWVYGFSLAAIAQAPSVQFITMLSFWGFLVPASGRREMGACRFLL